MPASRGLRGASFEMGRLDRAGEWRSQTNALILDPEDPDRVSQIDGMGWDGMLYLQKRSSFR